MSFGNATVNVVSTFTYGSYPYNGQWESAGSGYSVDFDSSGFITDNGSIDDSNVGGNTLVIAGVVTGYGYGGHPQSPSVIIAFAGNNYTQDFFESASFSFTEGVGNLPPDQQALFSNGTQVLYSANATFNPALPGNNLIPDNFTVWAWPVINYTDYFGGPCTSITTMIQFSDIAGGSGGGGGGGGGGSNVSVSFLAALNGEQFFTANGEVAIGANVFTYAAGTLTPVTTYASLFGNTANPNPIEVNTDGFLNTEIWVQQGTNTRVQVYDAGGVLLQDLDNIPAVPYVPTFAQVNVIDSIFATDTANAASANAANWNYKIASAAYNFANTVANNVANVSANIGTLSNSTITIEAGGAVVNVGNTINFNNTAFANIAVTQASNGAFNVAVYANSSTAGPSTNSSVTIGGIIFQWAYYTHSAAGEAGPFTDDFPTAFPNACLGVQLTTHGGPGAGGLVLSSFTKGAFTWYTQYAGAGTTGQYVFAYGY